MANTNSTRSAAARKLAEYCASVALCDVDDFPIDEPCTCERGKPCTNPQHGQTVKAAVLLTDPDERAARALRRFADAGVPAELLDDGELEGANEEECSPPDPPQRIVGRVLGVLGRDALKSSKDGRARSNGRCNGKLSRHSDGAERAIKEIEKHYPNWRKEPLTKERLQAMSRLIPQDSPGRQSLDALRKLLARHRAKLT